MMEPKDPEDPAILMEFKIQGAKEKDLSETVQAALCQIREKGDRAGLLVKGFSPEQIRKYGFAFRGKTVLIGRNTGEKS